MLPGLHRPRRRADGSTGSYRAVCAAGGHQTLGDPQGMGNTVNPGPHHLRPERKLQLVFPEAGLIVENFFWVQRVVYQLVKYVI